MGTKELWRPVVGYEGSYIISNYGNIMSLPKQVYRIGRGVELKPGRLMTQFVNRGGYKFVFLFNSKTNTRFLIHRLVATAFLENKMQSETVNHIDGNKTNNHISNLEWCTRLENIQHAIDTGLINFNRKKIVQLFNGVVVAEYNSVSEVETNGFKRPGVSNCLIGARKTYKGFQWKYAA